MKYLTPQDVLLLHDMAIEESGGSHGVRDVGLMESAIHRPQSTFGGQDLYAGIFDKTAALCQSLIKNHPFVDGNKRTALFAAMTFLELNGHLFESSQEELVEFGIAIDTKDMSIEDIAEWFQAHAKRG